MELTNKTNYKIEWQKRWQSKYLTQSIKKTGIVISVVSLACYLTMLYNRKLIMLSGSNYFEDANYTINQKYYFYL